MRSPAHDAYAQLGIDVVKVPFHGPRRDVKAVGNGGVRVTSDEALDDLRFTGGQSQRSQAPLTRHMRFGAEYQGARMIVLGQEGSNRSTAWSSSVRARRGLFSSAGSPRYNADRCDANQRSTPWGECTRLRRTSEAPVQRDHRLGRQSCGESDRMIGSAPPSMVA